MHRVRSALCSLLLLNSTMLSSGAVCDQMNGQPSATHRHMAGHTAEHAEHAEHAAVPAARLPAQRTAPGDDHQRGSTCPLMTGCADVMIVVLVTARGELAPAPDRVVALAGDRLPASFTSPPDAPPPKA